MRKVPGAGTTVRVVVFLLGLSFIGLGLALVVLPGPFTIPPILVGLLIWSLEFPFAERWLIRVRDQATEAWDAARRRPWRTVGSLALSLTLLVAAVVLAQRYDVMGRVTGMLG